MTVEIGREVVWVVGEIIRVPNVDMCKLGVRSESEGLLEKFHQMFTDRSFAHCDMVIGSRYGKMVRYRVSTRSVYKVKQKDKKIRQMEGQVLRSKCNEPASNPWKPQVDIFSWIANSVISYRVFHRILIRKLRGKMVFFEHRWYRTKQTSKHLCELPRDFGNDCGTTQVSVKVMR